MKNCKGILFCFVVILAGVASAASINWSDPIANAHPDTTGTLLEAVNVGGVAITVGDVDFADGYLSAVDSTYANFVTAFPSCWDNAWGSAANDTGDAGLNELLRGHRWTGDTTATLTLQNLVVGTLYQIQLYFTDDRGCCNTRTYMYSDGVGGDSAVWARGDDVSFIGTFSADAETQTIQTIVQDGSDPGLCAYVLRTIPASDPVITTQPSDQTVDPLTTASVDFIVEATNPYYPAGTLTGPTDGLGYQWQFDGGSGFADLTGETNSTLTVTTDSGDGHDGSYRCVVSVIDDGSGVAGGSVTSTQALLTYMIVSDEKMIARYEFNDNGDAAIAVDSSGFGNDATITGAVYVDDSEQGQVLQFDGSGDVVTLPQGFLDLFNTEVDTEVTFSMMLYGGSTIASSNDGVAFWSTTPDATNRFFGAELPWRDGNIYYNYGRNCCSYRISTSIGGGDKAKGKWNHFVFTRNSETGYSAIYHNGSLIHDGYQSHAIEDLNAFAIGGKTDASSSYDGMIREFRVYNYELSAPEIQDLYFEQFDYKAIAIEPPDGMLGVSVETDLSWTGYTGADSFKVYLGTTNTPEFVVEQTASTYTPTEALDPKTEYFWRVDTVIGGQEYPGDLWSFKTDPGPFDPNTYGIDFDEIIFIKRRPYMSDHYYTVINNGTPSSLFQAENGIYIYNIRTKQERPVITAADFPAGTSGTGVIGKFTLSFDATKVIFDYRDHEGAGFRIWEVNIDGTDLRQVLQAPADEADKIARWNGGSNFHTDDVDPAYLPDGGIIFSSSRCEQTILCGGSAGLATAVMHRVDADGQNVDQLSRSPVSEFCPYILDDGRVMYHRWEYLDKGHRTPKCIYSMNPDGTKQQELFGLSDSYYNTGAHMYPKPVPGNDNKIVFVSAAHYPQGNTLGPIQIVDLSKDNRTLEGLTRITPDVMMKSAQEGWYFSYDGFSGLHTDGVGGPLYTDPCPISATQFLVSCKYDWNAHYRNVPSAYAIYLLDIDGNQVSVYKDPDYTTSCWHPTPLVARKTPPKIYSFRHPTFKAENEALCIVTNVYQGMDGVSPGEVKWLRINEDIPRYWDTRRKWSPSAQSNSWKAALWPRVQWGVVPVEADGSAYFTVPADRNIFMQALDENFQELQRERTYVNYRPGEIRSCVGCHEKAGQAAMPIGRETPIALTRAPSELQAQPCDLIANGGDGRPEQVIHYPTDIQPIFNANCIVCHSGSNPTGNLTLTDTLTAYYNVSYEQLLSKELAGYAVPEFGSITPGKGGGNDLGSYLPPKSMGCYDSPMIAKLTDPEDENHYQLLDANELMILRRWVDTNYQYHGTYYGRHHSNWSSDPDFRKRPTFEEAIDMFAPAWHD